MKHSVIGILVVYIERKTVGKINGSKVMQPFEIEEQTV